MLVTEDGCSKRPTKKKQLKLTAVNIFSDIQLPQPAKDRKGLVCYDKTIHFVKRLYNLATMIFRLAFKMVVFKENAVPFNVLIYPLLILGKKCFLLICVRTVSLLYFFAERQTWEGSERAQLSTRERERERETV